MDKYILKNWGMLLQDLMHGEDAHYYISVDVSNNKLFNEDTRRFQITLILIIRTNNIYFFKSFGLDGVDVMYDRKYILNTKAFLIGKNSVHNVTLNLEDDNPFYISMNWEDGEVIKGKHLSREDLISQYIEIILANMDYIDLLKHVVKGFKDKDREQIKSHLSVDQVKLIF